VRGIRIVDDLTRPLTATLYAKIYRDIDFDDVDVRFDALEEQRTLTKIALHGWRRFNKAAHSLPPHDKLLDELDVCLAIRHKRGGHSGNSDF
jgi:hypothetical protein